MEKCSSRTDTHTHTPRLHACAGQECRTRTGTQARHATDGIRPGRTHCEASTVSTRGIRPGRTLLQVALQHSHWASDMRTGPSRSGRYGSWWPVPRVSVQDGCPREWPFSTACGRYRSGWPSITRIRPGRILLRVALSTACGRYRSGRPSIAGVRPGRMPSQVAL